MYSLVWVVFGMTFNVYAIYDNSVPIHVYICSIMGWLRTYSVA